ncbi:hypothetical protein C2E23DRAFT_720799, partial [Lenzites betulinus]
PSLPPRDPASVLERFRAFPLSELIFPEHLRLRDATTWKAYKNAVQLVCELKGVEKHLERPAINEHRAPAWWNEEEKLCRAIILLNILDIGRFDLDDCTFTVECWEELKRVHEPPARTRPKRETCFEFVRASLGRTFARRWVWLLMGWWIGVYRHAVETICCLHGVEQNLEFLADWATESPTLSGTPDGGQAREEWLRREDLCKAIITLNVKDFPRYGIRAGPHCHASVVWRKLVEMHTKKRSWWEMLFGWMRPFTALEKVLLMVILACLWQCWFLGSELRYCRRL